MSSQFAQVGSTVFVDLSCECQTPLEWLDAFAEDNKEDDLAFVVSGDFPDMPQMAYFFSGAFVPSMRRYDFHVIVRWYRGE